MWRATRRCRIVSRRRPPARSCGATDCALGTVMGVNNRRRAARATRQRLSALRPQERARAARARARTFGRRGGLG